MFGTRTLFGFLLLATICLAQNAQTLDDADSSLTYAGTWTHDNTGASYLNKGTQSWTNDPAATVSFTFTGQGFDLCAGLKADRGTFKWTIDGTASGSGTEQGSSMVEAACQNVASVRDLSSGSHTVVFSNGGSSYFSVDYIKLYLTATASSTTAEVLGTLSAVPNTTAQRGRSSASRSSSSFSMSILPSSNSSSTASSSSATALTAQQDHATVSSHKKAAMIGGSLAGGIVAAVLLALAAWQVHRRRSSSSGLDDDLFSPATYQDEKHFEWSEKTPMARAASPSAGFGFGLSRSQGSQNLASAGSNGGGLHKRSISRQESFNSHHSEPFQAEILQRQPQVEPYYPQQFTPTHSASNSVSSSIRSGPPVNVFNSPPRQTEHSSNVSHPFAVAPLRTKSSYENRLAAASASLPDWHSTQPIPRYNQNQLYPVPAEARASTASSAYPPSEAPNSVNRASMMSENPYGGLDMESTV